LNTNQVLFERTGPIARITLNRPEKLNALTDEMQRGLLEALSEVERDPSLKVSVLSGSGDHFSSGYDLVEQSAYTQIKASIQHNLGVVRDMRATHQAIWNSRKPIIGKIRGYCLAGGCDLQMLCDVSVASNEAKLGNPGVSIGGVSAMPLYAWTLGTRKAKELLLTGKLIDGEEAARIGLVNEAVPDDLLDTTVETLAQQMATLPVDSLTLCKESLNLAADAMGLAAIFRSAGMVSALSRFGEEVNVDLSKQRERITGAS